jgi:hypothetical protein
MKVTGSELLAFDRCPEFRRNLWEKRRQKQHSESEAQALGKWAHEILANMMKGISPGQLELPWFSQLAKARALRLALLAWWDRYSVSTPWSEVILVEEPLTAQIRTGRPPEWAGDVILQGIPDAMVLWQGALWHCQHKTLDQSQSVENFACSVAQSLHESIYAILAKNRWPELRYGGTMLNIVRKMSEGAMLENASRALWLEFLPIGDRQIERAKDDILWMVDHFDEPWRRRSGCVEVGRGKCPYYEACWEGISLSDDSIYEDAIPDERYVGYVVRSNA